MAQQNKRFQVKVIALAGGVLLLLGLGVVLMAAVLPLATWARMVQGAGLARAQEDGGLAFVILATPDTQTLMPTVTPANPTATGVVLSATPVSTQPAAATPVMATAAPILAAAAPGLATSTTVPEPAEATAAPVETQTTPDRQPAATATIAPTVAPQLPDTPAPTQTAVATPSETPITGPGEPSQPPASSVTPGEAPTLAPTGTPASDPAATSTPWSAPEDLQDFEFFLRRYRGTIAGELLEVVSLALDTTDGAVPLFVLSVAGSEAESVFAAQPTADVLAYGRVFLDDAKRYLGDEACAIAVESTYATSNSDACAADPTWCRLGTYDPSTATWPVTWTYVRGTFTGGTDSVEAWNTGE